MSKHTPGPWEIKKSPFEVYNLDHGSLTHEICAGDIMLAALYADPESQDARLMASAPDLLAAAERVLAKLDHPTLGVTIYDADALRDAIAKARGEA